MFAAVSIDCPDLQGQGEEVKHPTQAAHSAGQEVEQANPWPAQVELVGSEDAEDQQEHIGPEDRFSLNVSHCLTP